MTKNNKVKDNNIEIATFYVEDTLMGIDIQHIQEINRHLDTTTIPGASEFVHGVINLRGEVVTVLDLHNILGLNTTEITKQSRVVIVKTNEELVGLWVDRIADVVNVKSEEIEGAPANISGVDSHFFEGVFKMESELLVILDIDKIMDVNSEAAIV
ncbi:MAG: chemotaxis protein CheW [Phycisphaerae bacterium]|nr:chemotaxis protein CheW [Phycisphaerae bacterium]